jgi:chemotaxis protein methyltransferase CheR
VRFETRNLADATAPLGDDASFDAVFLRNVAIYWDVDATRRLVARLARLLRQNGRLYLGHAETLRGLSDAFDVRSEDGAYFYVKRTSATPRDAGRYDVPRGDVPAARPIDDRSAPGAWFEEIGRSAVRVAEIAAAADSGAAAGDDATPGLDKAVVRAAALVCEGRIDEAEETCAQALKDDPSNADAHYVLALCRERRGDAKAALDFDATAAKLDPRFAMPRLHMGMLARREGDFSAARRELRAAARLLQDEHPSRLEAFGGDFGREALAALCVAAAAEAESA